MLVSCMQALNHRQFLRLFLRTWLIPLEPFSSDTESKRVFRIPILQRRILALEGVSGGRTRAGYFCWRCGIDSSFRLQLAACIRRSRPTWTCGLHHHVTSAVFFPKKNDESIHKSQTSKNSSIHMNLIIHPKEVEVHTCT